jgi:hypothetical protein
MSVDSVNVESGSCAQDAYHTIVANGAMLDVVYAMRYRSYGEAGYIEENPLLKFADEYDGQSNVTSFLLHRRGEAVGSMRTCVFDPRDRMPVPAMDVFDDEIRHSIGYDNVFVEVNKFVIEPSFQRRGGVRMRLMLIGTVIEEAVRKGASNILLAVRPAHVGFYEMLGCVLLSGAKAYPHLAFETVLMATLDIQSTRRFIRSKVKVEER